MKMSKSTLISTALLSLAGAALQAGAEETVPPEVQALYEKQCGQWSQQNWIADDRRTAFYRKCMQDIPKAVPSGYESSDGEGE